MHLQKVFVILLLAYTACCLARELGGGAGAAEQRHATSVQHDNTAGKPTYEAALFNSSCHGFLLGIGTQKGKYMFVLWLAEQPDSCCCIIGMT